MKNKTKEKFSKLLKLLGLNFCGVLVIGSSIAIGMNSCKHKPAPSPDITSITINETNVSSYMITANTNIYVSDIKVMHFGHNLLNLQKLMNANGGITNFVIDGTINFGLLVNPDMDCEITGINSATIICDGLNAGYATGLIVGDITPNHGVYNGKLKINSNVSFDISACNTGYIYGTYFNSTAINSIITIDGTFNIHVYTTFTGQTPVSYPVFFGGDTLTGSIIINGVFQILAVLDSLLNPWFLVLYSSTPSSLWKQRQEAHHAFILNNPQPVLT